MPGRLLRLRRRSPPCGRLKNQQLVVVPLNAARFEGLCPGHAVNISMWARVRHPCLTRSCRDIRTADRAYHLSDRGKMLHLLIVAEVLSVAPRNQAGQKSVATISNSE